MFVEHGQNGLNSTYWLCDRLWALFQVSLKHLAVFANKVSCDSRTHSFKGVGVLLGIMSCCTVEIPMYTQ